MWAVTHQVVLVARVLGIWQPWITEWRQGWKFCWTCHQYPETSSSSMLGIKTTGNYFSLHDMYS